MSGIVKGVKKRFKKAVRFVKKHWKKIVIAALIVFTAGIATVGLAGFSTAMTTAGGGFAGFMSAAGSTMVAGVSAIGGSLGIGQGANLAAFGGTGTATLGTGAAAQSLGLAAQGASATAGSLAATTPTIAGAGGTLAAAAGPPAALATGGATAAGAAAAPAAGGLLSSASTPALLSAGSGLLQSYSAARQREEDREAEQGKGFWGVGLNGNESASFEQPANQGGMWNPASFQPPQQNMRNQRPAPMANTSNMQQTDGTRNMQNMRAGLMAQFRRPMTEEEIAEQEGAQRYG